MQPSRVISTGEHGVPLGALQAARKSGIETWGLTGPGFRTADGVSGRLRDYGVEESPDRHLVDRLRKLGDLATMVIVIRRTPLVNDPAKLILPNIPVMVVAALSLRDSVDLTRLWWSREFPNPRDQKAQVLLVEGDSERQSPGIRRWAAEFLEMFFHALEKQQATDSVRKKSR